MFPGVKSTLTLGHKAPRKAQKLELRWYDMEESEGRLQKGLEILPATKEGQSEDPDGIGDVTKYCFSA